MNKTAIAIVILSCSAALNAQQEPALATSEARTIYALGHRISEGLTGYRLSQEELEILILGLRDGATESEPRVDPEKYLDQIRAFVQRRQSATVEARRAEAQSFLDRFSREEGAETLASGLIFRQTKAGSGAPPGSKAEVLTHYEGRLLDGTVFDSSLARGEPASFRVDEVIPCWQEALQRMKPRSAATLVCPPKIAYGDRAIPGIPAGSTLVYDVRLLGIRLGEGESWVGRTIRFSEWYSYNVSTGSVVLDALTSGGVTERFEVTFDAVVEADLGDFVKAIIRAGELSDGKTSIAGLSKSREATSRILAEARGATRVVEKSDAVVTY